MSAVPVPTHKPTKVRITVAIAKALVVVAAIVFLAGIAITALAYHVISAPYRNTRGRSKRRIQLEAFTALVTSIVALVAAFRGRDAFPKGWHACENPTCRAPITNVSRAKYCSEQCRRHTKIRAEAGAIDDEIPY